MEEKKEYLNEEEYQRNNAKVKKAGKIVIIVGLSMLVVGIILIILGVLGIGTEATSSQAEVRPTGIFLGFGAFAVGGTLTTTGIFVTVVGLMIRFIIGNRREIAAYTTQQAMPVVKESAEKIAPTAGKVAKEVAKGVKEGINEANKEK